MFSVTYIRFSFLLVCFISCIALVDAKDDFAKRGLAYGNWSKSDVDIWDAQKSPLTWYYNFKAFPSKGVNHYKMQFVPMIWGNNGSFNFYDTVKGLMDSGMDIEYVLGYNEPDICYGGGSCIDAVTAADSWQKQIEPLKKLGVKLGAPAVTGGDFTWLQEFFTACDGKCSTDFIPLHYYATITGLREWTFNISDLYPNNTIWVTEFACPNCDTDLNAETFNQSISYLDGAKYVERYSYFGAFRANTSNDFLGPNVAMLDDAGGMTDIGTWYFGLPESDVGKKNIGPAATATAAPTPSAANGSNNSSAATKLSWPWWQVLGMVGTLSLAAIMR